MKHQSGVALLTVLIFMQIWTILGMLALETAWLTTKSSHAIWRRHERVIASQSILTQLEERIETLSSQCAIDRISTQELLSKPINWWRLKPFCQGSVSLFNYYYVVEPLGVDPCGYIKMQPKVLASYFRLSVLMDDQANKMLLQSTVVLPAQSALLLTCQGLSHHVGVGRQMRRELVFS